VAGSRRRIVREDSGGWLRGADLWFCAAIASPIGTDFVEPWNPTYYAWWSGTVIFAALATTVALSGLLERAAARRILIGLAAGVLSLGVAGLGVGTWLWQLGIGGAARQAATVIGFGIVAASTAYDGTSLRCV
jgi:hypothetical protein